MSGLAAGLRQKSSRHGGNFFSATNTGARRTGGVGGAAGSPHHPEVLGLLYGVMHSMLVLVLHAARVLCCRAAGVTDGA
jgi:hypothetical protein